MTTKYLNTTQYYEEFLRYFKMATTQQKECNLGIIAHENSSVNDDLMKHVHLYDVVERKYAGFSQIVNDAYYGWSEDHPYWNKMISGNLTTERDYIAKKWDGKRKVFGLPEWLYVFLVHRLTGSGINYAKKPSGYHNTILFDLWQCDTIEQMTDIIRSYWKPFYTSVGYQFPAFPKPGAGYKKGGDYFLCEFVPTLARDTAAFLETPGKKDLRQVGDFMFAWNEKNNLRKYKFQYAAFIADIADWFPDFVNRESPFYYGTNARECLKYLSAKPTTKINEDQFLDLITQKIYEDTGAFPYNSEDVTCDMIRWIENYCKVGNDYNHLDLDHVWNSSTIKDHPKGRQKAMLDLGLIPTFNHLDNHPSDFFILDSVGMTEAQYKEKVKGLYTL